MRDLWTALALVLVIEGALYALFPEGMKRAARARSLSPAANLAAGGARCRLRRCRPRLAGAPLAMHSARDVDAATIADGALLP